MELSKVMEERRSVRHYNEKSLDKKTIEDILNYAIWHHLLIIDNHGILWLYKIRMNKQK